MADIDQIFRGKLRRLKQEVAKLPRFMGNEAVKHFRESFDGGGVQSFNDHGASPWANRKKEDPGRALLVKSGNLRDSIEILRISKNEVEVGSREDYAAIHNRGLMGKAWGKHPFKMPQRKFIGKSQKLNHKLRDDIERRIKKALR